MGIWGNPAATKKNFLLILGGAPAPGAPPPPAYATGSWRNGKSRRFSSSYKPVVLILKISRQRINS